jgi:hypothetical protein
VTLIPCFIIILILVLVDAGLLPSLGGIAAVPSSLIGGVSSVSPQAGAYISGIYNSLLALMGLNGNGLIIIMVFGLIGGMMADMNKKEVAQATGNSHVFDGFSSFLSGANIGKFADLVAERVLWTFGTMDSGRKKLFQRSHPEPSALGFGNMKSLPPPSFNQGPQSGLKEWIGPEPEPAFGYDSPYEEEELDLLEGLPNWEPKPPRKKTRMKRNPYEEEWGVSHRDLSEESLIDSPKARQKKGTKSTGRSQRGTRKSTPKKRSPTRKPQKKNAAAYDSEDFEIEEEIKPRRKAPVRKTEKRDAVIYDGSGEELALKKVPRKRTISGKKKQPALIKRALETQDKIEEVKAAPEPSILEEKAPKPKREKIVQNFEML